MIIWLASYPKSGNTWVRFFILSLLFGNKTEINLNHLKSIEQFPSKSQFAGLELDITNLREVAKNWITVQKKINLSKKVRFYKTHNTLCQIDKNRFTDQQNTLGAIYIVRDPRNVITSVKNHFNHNSYEEAKNFIFDEKRVVLLSRPTDQKDYSLPQIIGSWQTHYKTWKIMNKNFLLSLLLISKKPTKLLKLDLDLLSTFLNLIVLSIKFISSPTFKLAIISLDKMLFINILRIRRLKPK